MTALHYIREKGGLFELWSDIEYLDSETKKMRSITNRLAVDRDRSVLEEALKRLAPLPQSEGQK